ncbi:MAG: SLC13 family permease [Planctomycetota bacterium]
MTPDPAGATGGGPGLGSGGAPDRARGAGSLGRWCARGAALALLLGALFAPGLAIGGAPLEDPQRQVLGVTAFTATLWLTAAAPVALASIAPAALLVAFGVLEPRALTGLHGHRLVLLFLGAFVVALGLERWGVHRRIALFVIARVGSSRSRVVLGFMAASAFLSMWINNTATTLMLVPIVGAVLARFDEASDGEPNPRFGYCLLLGVAYSASVGGMVTPVGTAPNQVYLGQLESQFPGAPEAAFAQWTVAFLPLALLFVPVGWFVLTRIAHRLPEGDGASVGVDVIRAERVAQGPLAPAQLRMAALFVTTAVLWVFRRDLELGGLVVPGWTGLLTRAGVPASSIGDHHVALAMALLLLVLPAGRGPADGVERHGRSLVDLRTALRVPWDVLLLLGGGFCIAAGFAATGLDDRVGAALAPLLEDRPRWVVVGTVTLAVSFLTEVTSNTATTVVLMPVLAASAVEAGLDPRAVMLPGALAASAAFMLPVATPPNAVAFATRRVPMLAMARAGVLLNFAMVLIVLAVLELWALGRMGLEEGVPTWAR